MIIVDLIIFVILLLFVLLGYKKGLTGALIKIFSFVIAIIIAFILYKPVSNFVINNTQIDESIKKSIIGVSKEKIVEEEKEENKRQTSSNNLSEVMQNFMQETVIDHVNETKDIIVDKTATELSHTIVRIGTLIALYLLGRIILKVISILSNIITKLPIIKQIDKIGGLVIGIVQGLFVIYLILAIISLLAPVIQESAIINGINQSFITKMMYHNNLILKILFKV